MRTVAAVLAALAAAAPSAGPFAQTTAVVALQSAQDIARQGLEAQFQAALILERRLAAERERRLIEGYEAALTSARAEYDAGRAGAEAALIQARADFSTQVRLVAERAAQSDAALRAELDAYRTAALGLVAEASPERLVALQRFADGDRVGSWPVIEAGTAAKQARLDAAITASKTALAAEVRENAELRAVMRYRGEATSADVLALWDQAATLDPSDFNAHSERARLALELGRLPVARAAADAAFASAVTDRDRAGAMEVVGLVATELGDLVTARAAYDAAVALTVSMAMEYPASIQAKRDLSVALERRGDVAMAENDLAVARVAYEHSLAIARALSAQEPTSTEAKRDVAVTLYKLGDVALAEGNLAAARSAYKESLAVARELVVGDATSAQNKYYLARSLSNLGDVAMADGDLVAARAAYEESLSVRRGLASMDPTAGAKSDLANSLDGLGDVAVAEGDLAAARAAYTESLAVARSLAAGDPTSSLAKRDLIIGLIKMDEITGERSHAAEALDIALDMQARGILAPADAWMVEDLRKRAGR